MERLWVESGCREAAEMAANVVGRKRSKAQEERPWRRGRGGEARAALWLRIHFPLMNHMCPGGRERRREQDGGKRKEGDERKGQGRMGGARAVP